MEQVEGHGMEQFEGSGTQMKTWSWKRAQCEPFLEHISSSQWVATREYDDHLMKDEKAKMTYREGLEP